MPENSNNKVDLTETRKKILEQKIVNGFIDKIYSFSFNKTGNHVDTNDLSQEILLEVFSALGKVERIRNFNAWLWSIARNTYYRWLNQKLKVEDNFIYCDFGFFKGLDKEKPDDDKYELINLIHREISFLSQIHRKVFVSHYLKGMKCREIAEEHNVPAGTVKRILSEARKNIKKGVNEMREYNEKYHTPMTLSVRVGDIHGSGINPKELTKRKITQTILLEAFEKPVSIQKINSETGIPYVYIEDEVQSLIDSELMTKIGKELFQTNFIIRKGSLKEELINLMKNAVNDFVPEYDKIIEQVKTSYKKENLNSQDYPWERFLWIVLYRIYSLVYHNSTMAESYIAGNSDGEQWQAYGFIKEDNYSEDERIAWGWHDKPRGVIMPSADGSGFVAYRTYWSLGQKLLVNGRPALYSDEIAICQKIFSDNFHLENASEQEKMRLAELIQENVIENVDGKLALKVLAFTREQHHRIDELILENSSGAIKIYENIMNAGIKLVKKYAPKGIDGNNIKNFVLSGQGAGGIAGLIYNEYVKRGDVCKIDANASFTPTCYLILN